VRAPRLNRRSLAAAGAAGLAALGVAACTDAPAPAPDAGGRPGQLTNRVWVSAANSPPGGMLIFMSDGTLLQDSCWETYRLSQWRLQPGQRIVWQEDTEEISATIEVLTATELTLRLALRSGPLEQSYVAAAVPYVCPDMPR
jgi:hypothetical protein